MVQIIAEVAQAHDGSLGTAHAYIDAAADAGANAIKFQTHIAAAESSPGEPWRVKFSPQDDTRYEYWQRMEFSEPQWHGLKQHADERGLAFYSSAFSVEAVELLTRVGVAGWKIASGEVGNTPMLERMAAAGLPFLISTGMSPWSEIDLAVNTVRGYGLPITVFQCTSMYPTPPEKIGLNVIPLLRERYNDCAVGLSDHSGNIYSGLAAAALGVDVLEVHITFHRAAFGPDVPASVTVDELRQLVEGVRFIERTNAAPVDKDAMATELQGMRDLFTKSLFAAQDLPAGTVLAEDHIMIKKPGTGIPAHRLSQVLGQTLQRPVAAGTMLAETDLA